MDQIRRDCDELRKMDPLDAMQRVFGAMKDGGGSSLAILALDKGIAEVIRLRNAVIFADQQGAEAIERVSSAIIADKWNATAEFQERALKAEAERDELRLSLAAEQGRQEGAPSKGWNCSNGRLRTWHKYYGDNIHGVVNVEGDWMVYRAGANIYDCQQVLAKGAPIAKRAAMQAADEAPKTGSPS